MNVLRLASKNARRFSSSAPPELAAVLNSWKGGKVELEQNGTIARIVLNRPEKNNCLSGDMMIQLKTAVQDVQALPNIGVVVLEGKGKSFCSGADLGLIDQLSTSPLGSSMFLYMSATLSSLRLSPQLVVANLHGHCLGGATEIASSCDIRIAHKDCKIGFLQSRMGIVPSWGGASFLREIVGRSTALRLMTAAPIIGAEEAKSLGWIDEVYGSEDEAQSIINSYSHAHPEVTRAQKAMLRAVEKGKSEEDEVIRSVWGAPAQKSAIAKQLQNIVKKK